MLDASFLRGLGLSEDEFFFDEPLAPRTWIKTGGCAALLVEPRSSGQIASILRFCCKWGIPVFFLGNGSNLVVSDQGFQGVVITTGSLKDENYCLLRLNSQEFCLTIPSGKSVDDAVEMCCCQNLEGLEYFSGLPGTVGGAIFMNASCYDHAWSEIFIKAKIICFDGSVRWIIKKNHEWGYKKSPFQTLGNLILSVVIRLFRGPGSDKLLEIACARYKDREQKGHFRVPCAGSIFKNNRTFGRSSGQIIDSLGLRGRSLGGVQVALWHANIFINTGNATSQEIYDLTLYVQQKVRETYGYCLDPEVIFLGNFANNY